MRRAGGGYLPKADLEQAEHEAKNLRLDLLIVGVIRKAGIRELLFPDMWVIIPCSVWCLDEIYSGITIPNSAT
jgi:hypothetical protein